MCATSDEALLAVSSPLSDKNLRSTLISRNITIDGHRTSMRLEPAMWNGLSDICRRERASLHTVCSAVARQKPADTSLTAAIRVFIMSYYRAAATEEGHARSGHGQGPVGNAVLTLVQSVLDPAHSAPAMLSPFMIGKAYMPQANQSASNANAVRRLPRR